MNTQLVNVGDLARILSVHPQTVYRLAREKKIPHIVVGGSIRFDPDQVKESLKVKDAARS